MGDENISRRSILRSATGTAIMGIAGCAETGDDQQTTNRPETTVPTDDTGAQASGESIKFGYGIDLSGDFGFIGQNGLGSVQMVVQEVNDAGGIDGSQVKLLTADDQSNPNEAISVAKQMIEVDNVDVYMGHNSVTVMQVIPIIQEAKVPYVECIGSTSDLDDVGGEYIFRTWPSDSLAGIAAGLQVRREEYNGVDSFEQVGVLTCKNTNCQSLLAPLERTIDATDGTLTDVVEVTEGKGSYSAEIQKVMGGDPEVILVFANGSLTQQLLRAGFDAGYEGYWAGYEDHANKKFAGEVPSELADRMIVSRSATPEHITDDLVNEWQTKYEDQTGNEPGIGWRGAFDGAMVLSLAMKAASVSGTFDHATIAEQITEVARPPGTEINSFVEGADLLDDGEKVNFQGLMSACDFSENGEIKAPYDVFRIQEQDLQKVGHIGVEEIGEYQRG